MKCISLTVHSVIINVGRDGAVHGCYPLGKISSKDKYFYLVISINICN